MKPKNLKFPFVWEERSPLLQDGVLYVPKLYTGHHLWSKDELWSYLSSFPKIALEYCSGNGAWIAEKAQAVPSCLWIAVEKRFDRVQKLWSKKHNLSLSNLLVVCGDAREFSAYYLPDRSIDQIFINFPDPWPKAKHAKNRLIQEPFVREMARISKDLSDVVLVTDDEPYSRQMVAEMMKCDVWEPSFSSPFYRTEWPEYGASFFKDLWESRGKNIFYMKFEKISARELCHD